MSSERSSTATNSPKRLVTPDNSTATSLPVSGPAPLASGGCSLVFLSCNLLPPVRVVFKLTWREILRTRDRCLRVKAERREYLLRSPLAGLYGPVHVTVPFGGGLRPGPVYAAHRLGQCRTVIQDHTGNWHPRVSTTRVDFSPPIRLRVGQRAEGLLAEIKGEALEHGPLAFVGLPAPPIAGVRSKNKAGQGAGFTLGG